MLSLQHSCILNLSNSRSMRTLSSQTSICCCQERQPRGGGKCRSYMAWRLAKLTAPLFDNNDAKAAALLDIR